jgi:hypothetical protein
MDLHPKALAILAACLALAALTMSSKLGDLPGSVEKLLLATILPTLVPVEEGRSPRGPVSDNVERSGREMRTAH